RFLHFGQAGQEVGKAAGIVAIVRRQRYRDDVDERETEPVPVEDGTIAADQSFILEALPPAGTLRGRQVHALRKIIVRQPRIFLQMRQYLAVKLVETLYNHNIPPHHASSSHA